jgi:hypothetical protein
MESSVIEYAHWRPALFSVFCSHSVLYPNQTVLFFHLSDEGQVYGHGSLGHRLLGALNVNSGVSNFAHLGGMAFGYAYLRMRFFKVDLRLLQPRIQRLKLRRAKKRFQVYLRAWLGPGHVCKLARLLRSRVQSRFTQSLADLYVFHTVCALHSRRHVKQPICLRPQAPISRRT